MSKWKGIVIAESLEEPDLINDFNIYKEEVDIEEDQEIWHLYWVYATNDQIGNLKTQIKQGWYAHFWKENKIIAIFRDKKFEFLSDNKSTWKDVIEYGKSIGIPKKQLDFPTEWPELNQT